MRFEDTALPEGDLWRRVQERGQAVVYGTGNGADKVIDRLERDGVRICAVCAGQGFVRSRFFRGLPVISVQEAMERYPEELFLLAFGTSRESVIADIGAVSRQVTLIVPTVPVYGDEIFDFACFRRNEQQLREAFGCLADEESRRVFALAIRFYLTGELPVLFAAQSDEKKAFSEILQVSGREHYCDLGAYRGDTLRFFLQEAGGYASVTALEPDKKSFAVLRREWGALPRCRLLQKGIADRSANTGFAAGRGRGSHIAEAGKSVALTTVDELFADCPVTYLKADVEGAESDMLRGAQKTLAQQKPKLNIAAYHRTGDMWRLILQIRSVCPSYRIYLRAHRHIPLWDLNLYCI